MADKPSYSLKKLLCSLNLKLQAKSMLYKSLVRLILAYGCKCWRLSKDRNMLLISIIEPTICTIFFQFITISSLYMFRSLICSSSGGTVFITIGIFRAYYVSWLLQALEWSSTKNTNLIYNTSWWWACKCSKHVDGINRNKLKANSASFWSYYTDILRCMVNKPLRCSKSLKAEY
jgi:hypothetical protein